MTRTRALEDLAAIRTPLIFRDRAPEDAADGNARVFSIKDLVSAWPTDFNKLPRVRVEETKLSDSVKEGDVLMPGRGLAYPARLYEGCDLPLFPAGQVHILRVNTSMVNPRYLSWYLNRRDVQAEIAQMLTGSTIKALNKSQLQKVRVDVPARATQERIAKLQDLMDRRMALRDHLNTLEHLEFEAACRMALAREKAHD
jgi:restriction endonuclease S subunit